MDTQDNNPQAPTLDLGLAHAKVDTAENGLAVAIIPAGTILPILSAGEDNYVTFSGNWMKLDAETQVPMQMLQSMARIMKNQKEQIDKILPGLNVLVAPKH